MPGLHLTPFAPEHADGAADLLAARHRAQRLLEPALAARYEDPVETRTALDALLAFAGGSGAVAHRDGGTVGFVYGTPRESGSWGPNVWVEAAGHAATDAELVRDLYALAAARWVEEGRTAHYAIVPSGDAALVDAWFRLGFGHQHVHGLREVATDAECGTPTEVSVRSAERTDLPELARLELVLPAHQGLAPVFSTLPPRPLDEVLAEWETDFDTGTYTTFVAELDGTVVGSAVGCALEVSSMHTGMAHVDGAALLGFAVVDPHARGRGVGGALLDAVHGWAHEAGYPVIVTDWRMTNLLSSRMWAHRGFRPTFFRLHRAII